jgi:two-component sensor histidine kinase
MRLVNIDDYKSKLDIAKQYANYYDKIGSKQLSILHLNKYIILRDSFEKEENLKELIDLQIANQIEEKENLIAENQKKITAKNNEVLREKIIRNSLLVGGVLLIVIIIVIAYQLIKVNTQKKLLEVKNKKIKTRNSIIYKSLAEKDLLVKEVHHRVKNNLQIVSSLLKLQTLKTTNKDIQVSLGEAQDRINSMAVLHQLLYKNNQMTRLSFKDYLSTLITQISSSFSSINKKILINVSLIELELDIDTAIPLGLITNEIMSNAYKHAFSELKEGVINIELGKQHKDTYFLKISDNGVGIPANFDLSSIESLGLDIVSILSEQIDAELKIFNNNGAHFEIVFKA